MMKIRAFTHSAGRPINEDVFIVYNETNKILGTNHSEISIASDSYPLTIATMDGVGGHDLGGEAATLVAYSILQNPLETHNIERVVTSANEYLCSFSDHGYTTFTGIQVNSPREASFVHCGDSRLYLIQDGQIFQLSRDDSTATVLESVFHISPKEAHKKGQLTQCLGLKSPVLSVHNIPVNNRWIFLIATDGAYSLLDNHWETILKSETPEDAIIETLKNHICSEEADDNMTAITLCFSR